MKHKNLAIIQARMGSKRLPGKVLMKVNETPLLEYEIKRVQQAEKIDKLVLLTTNKKEDNEIEKLCQGLGIDCWRGPEHDLLANYYQCSLLYPGYENIIRICGDCPLIDPAIIDKLVIFFEKNNFDYATNAPLNKETFPDGLDVEIFKKSALAEASEKAGLRSEREHVTPYIANNEKLKRGSMFAQEDFSSFRLTVDERDDFEVIKFLIQKSKITDGWLKYICLLKRNPKIMAKNMSIKRNEGYLRSLEKEGKIEIR